MARITSQAAVDTFGNRFEMVLVAAQRARELMKGHLPTVVSNNGHVVTAIREIEAGKIGREYLKKVGRKDK